MRWYCTQCIRMNRKSEYRKAGVNAPATRSLSLMDRMIGYEPVDPGSIPGGSAI